MGLRCRGAMRRGSFRVVVAGAVMLPFYVFCSRLPAFAEAAQSRRHPFTLGDIWIFLYMGFFGVTINQICFTVGLRFTSVSHAAVIVGMGPIYTLIFAVLFKLERVTCPKPIAMALPLIAIPLLP